MLTAVEGYLPHRSSGPPGDGHEPSKRLPGNPSAVNFRCEVVKPGARGQFCAKKPDGGSPYLVSAKLPTAPFRRLSQRSAAPGMPRTQIGFGFAHGRDPIPPHVHLTVKDKPTYSAARERSAGELPISLGRRTSQLRWAPGWLTSNFTAQRSNRRQITKHYEIIYLTQNDEDFRSPWDTRDAKWRAHVPDRELTYRGRLEGFHADVGENSLGHS